MSIIVSMIAVFVLTVVAYFLELAGLHMFLGYVVPYVAILVFVVGFSCRIFGWARSPVPFCIPTTCGQQESLDWIKPNKMENPPSFSWVVVRMFLEVFLFRSLFRNTKAKAIKGPRLIYTSDKILWAAGLAFHWSFFVVIVRHLRLFVTPVPSFLSMIEGLDGFLQITLPVLYISDLVILGAVTYLFVRRVIFPQIRYISLPADFFPLFLLMGIIGTGILMRHVLKVDIVGVKAMINGIFTFSPAVAVVGGHAYMYYVHLFLVSSFLIYFPFSKLMHMGGVFFSPTRNMANNSRKIRHINPWNPDIKFHTYAEYEDDFRKVMKSVDLPLDKDIEEDN